MRYMLHTVRKTAVSLGAALLAASFADGGIASTVLFAGAFLGTFMLYTNISNRRIQHKYGLSRSELYYILDQLNEAKLKLTRLQNLFLKVRSLRSLKQLIELNSLVRRIYAVVKKEPRRFYDIEPFFYSHLDSVVEIAEKSAILSRNKIKDQEMKQSLLETKETLGDLSKMLERDLKYVLAKDIEQLSFELDVARQRTKRLDVTPEESKLQIDDKMVEKVHVTVEESKEEQRDDERTEPAIGTRYGRNKTK